MDGASVQPLAGNPDGVKGDVGAIRHVASKVEVLCKKNEQIRVKGRSMSILDSNQLHLVSTGLNVLMLVDLL